MMKKIAALIAAACSLNSAHAGFTQVTMEAEQIAGGSIVNNADASGGSAVQRTSVGNYVWWNMDSSTLTTGSYSVYARIAISQSNGAPANFGPQVVYGTTVIAGLNKQIVNHALAWVRIGSFDLNQIGGVLRVSDWSEGGLTIDKMAIVKDVVVEAEQAAGGTIITDTAASGGRAVTRTTPGNYGWWLPPQSEMKPGDYIVEALLASTDGASHNFGEVVAIDEVGSPNADAGVSSTAYQWVSLNSFVNPAGSQSVRIGDYSAEKLKLDKLRVVRRTPYDSNTSAQTLFAAGAAALATRDQVQITGVPNGQTALHDTGRAAIVQHSPSSVYAYFRQEQPAGSYNFNIYMATSADGGMNFTLNPEPLMSGAALAGVGANYDPQVSKLADNTYAMVFEGVVNSHFCAVAASSPDGVNNWVVRGVPVCPTGAISMGASVPNYFADVDNGRQYLQWATVDLSATPSPLTLRYQYQLANGLFSSPQLTFSNTAAIASKALPSPSGYAWEAKNNSAANVLYEDGYYYMVYDGSTVTSDHCDGRWGLGIMRSSTPDVLQSWTRSPKNPLIQAIKSDSCWIGYPDLVKLSGGTYLYYYDPETNYTSPQTIARKLILTN